ncbi:DUF1183 domain protein [Aspergillus ruber CBS 135680]|uniref:Store-operated calcium entry-associated regulatory factor n=1 Tax=Aspergillus ruber (strain CBS 135680) TaxID=1388766 RepID=A0A017S341_ASPRC|nr:uncharacterized protein EURHEDRAFT_417349 [Aspergillus ruber CBS 135680]EYE90565.1 hypothetical protein EURHEDRAFT_417349 [Aspergillus ruber CBS 135680]
MRSLIFFTFILLLSLLYASPAFSFGYGSPPKPAKNAILLSDVKSLTLRVNQRTTSRRVSPIPQLTCIGPSKRVCNLYTIDAMRCTNAGSEYDKEDIQWTCTAPLPPEFKLGSTDVICEGYRDADDKWVLKGSCGVEYRLLLTEAGEEKFGGIRDESNPLNAVGNSIFFGFMVAAFIFILWPVVLSCFDIRRDRPDQRRGWEGFWGGGGPGGGNGGPYPGPPPPYSRYPEPSPSPSAGGWRPGFWTGAIGGTAAGYEMGRRSERYGSPFGGRRMGARYDRDPWEGNSRTRSSPGFSTTTTGTGFGSTRRR